MNDTKQATERPWRCETLGSEGPRIYPDCVDKRERLKYVAIVNARDWNEDQANAELIVRSVNAMPALVAALQTLVEHAQEQYPHFESPRGQHDILTAQNALKLARGE